MVKASKPSSVAATEPKPKPKGRRGARGRVRQASVEPWPVIWPEVDCQMLLGNDALTAELAQKLLGWTYDREEAVRKGCPDALFEDETGRNVYCIANAHNRPFDEATARRYAQDILNKHWSDGRLGETVNLLTKARDGSTKEVAYSVDTFNGETIVLSRTGRVLSGQHRLVGLVLAAQIWAGVHGVEETGKLKTRHTRWQDAPYWVGKEPTIECFLAVGISDAPTTVRTLDNVRTRTLGDVLYTEGDLFPNLAPSARVPATRILGNSIKFLWDRTDMRKDSWTSALTHSEGVDFLRRHPSLADAVTHIHQEYKARPKVLRDRFHIGSAAGLMYLMGMSASGGADGLRDGRNRLVEYANAEPAPSEKVLDRKNWKRAARFWSLLCADDKSLTPVLHVFAEITNSDPHRPASMTEKTSVLCRAWEHFLVGENATRNRCSLEMETDKVTGRRRLTKVYSVGGIDIGNRLGKAKEEGVPVVPIPEDQDEDGPVEEHDEPDAGDPSPKDLEEATKPVRGKRPVPKGLAPTVPAGPKATEDGEDGEDGKAPKAPTLKDELEDLRAEYPGRLLIIRNGNLCRCWDGDATRAAKSVPGTKVRKHPTEGLDIADFPVTRLREYVDRMRASGYRPLSVEIRGGEKVINELVVWPEESAKGKGKGKGGKPPTPKGRPAPKGKPAPKPTPTPAGKGKAKAPAAKGKAK